MNKLKKIFKIIIFICIILLFVVGIQPILQVKTGHRGTDNIKGFYELPDNSAEVIFVGASTMFCTADPLQLYEEWGITSYDLCSSIQPVAMSELCMEEMFKTQSPKVVVFETTICTKELSEDGLAYAINDMPQTCEKLRALKEMFSDKPEEIVKYIFPILQYKDRWQELEKSDFTMEPESWDRYSMGAYTPEKVAEDALNFDEYKAEGVSTLPEKNIEYIKKMHALCKAHGAEFVLFKSPSIGWTEADTRAIEAIAQQENIPFLESYSMIDSLGIDPASDFRDNSHLNRKGIKKTSKWIGEYLKENYQLNDYRNDTRATLWSENIAKRNRDYYNQSLQHIENLEEYIQALPRDGYLIAVQLAGQVNEEDSEKISSLLENKTLGGAILSYNGLTIRNVLPGEDELIWNSRFDSIRMNGYSISYDGDVKALVDDGIIILVYDEKMGQLVDLVGFDTYGGGYATRE